MTKCARYILLFILIFTFGISADASRNHKSKNHFYNYDHFNRVFPRTYYDMYFPAPYRSPDFVHRKPVKILKKYKEYTCKKLFNIKYRRRKIPIRGNYPQATVFVQDNPDTNSDSYLEESTQDTHLEKDFTERITKRLFTLFSGRNIRVEVLELKPSIMGCSARIKIYYPTADGENKIMFCSAKDSSIKNLAKLICDNAAANLGKLESTNRARLGISTQ